MRRIVPIRYILHAMRARGREYTYSSTHSHIGLPPVRARPTQFCKTTTKTHALGDRTKRLHGGGLSPRRNAALKLQSR